MTPIERFAMRRDVWQRALSVVRALNDEPQDMGVGPEFYQGIDVAVEAAWEAMHADLEACYTTPYVYRCPTCRGVAFGMRRLPEPHESLQLSDVEALRGAVAGSRIACDACEADIVPSLQQIEPRARPR